MPRNCVQLCSSVPLSLFILLICPISCDGTFYYVIKFTSGFIIVTDINWIPMQAKGQGHRLEHLHYNFVLSYYSALFLIFVISLMEPCI